MVWNNVGIKTNGVFLSSTQFKNKIASSLVGSLEV
jgi:hypothetical protein